MNESTKTDLRFSITSVFFGSKGSLSTVFLGYVNKDTFRSQACLKGKESYYLYTMAVVPNPRGYVINIKGYARCKLDEIL